MRGSPRPRSFHRGGGAYSRRRIPGSASAKNERGSRNNVNPARGLSQCRGTLFAQIRDRGDQQPDLGLIGRDLCIAVQLRRELRERIAPWWAAEFLRAIQRVARRRKPAW